VPDENFDIANPTADFMRLVAARPDAAASDESDDTPITPRGMAAPPAPRATRQEADAARPATIRIEAAVRAAPPLRHRDLERELDRAQAAAAGKQGPFGHHLHRLLVSQGLVLNAFVILLVFGWHSPVPGWRVLLGGLALAGAVLAGWVGVVLRSGRRALRATGHERTLGLLALRALPASFIAGWIALSLYALALPPSAKASEEARQAAPQPGGPAPAKDTRENLP